MLSEETVRARSDLRCGYNRVPISIQLPNGLWIDLGSEINEVPNSNDHISLTIIQVESPTITEVLIVVQNQNYPPIEDNELEKTFLTKWGSVHYNNLARVM